MLVFAFIFSSYLLNSTLLHSTPVSPVHLDLQSTALSVCLKAREVVYKPSGPLRSAPSAEGLYMG